MGAHYALGARVTLPAARAAHPSALCSNDRDFWCTTGMYPQEFVLQLPAAVQVSKIKTLTTNGACVPCHWPRPCA